MFNEDKEYEVVLTDANGNDLLIVGDFEDYGDAYHLYAQLEGNLYCGSTLSLKALIYQRGRYIRTELKDFKEAQI